MKFYTNYSWFCMILGAIMIIYGLKNFYIMIGGIIILISGIIISNQADDIEDFEIEQKITKKQQNEKEVY